MTRTDLPGVRGPIFVSSATSSGVGRAEILCRFIEVQKRAIFASTSRGPLGLAMLQIRGSGSTSEIDRSSSHAESFFKQRTSSFRSLRFADS